jgi:hypothetical protein
VSSISAKCSDLFSATYKGKDYEGYVPRCIGIGDNYGDYVEFDYCLECGQIQGTWPVDDPEWFAEVSDEDDED